MKKKNLIFFYLQLIRFRKLFLIKVFVLLSLLPSAQGKFMGDADDLSRKTKLKKIPTMSVWDKKGTKYDLADYISKNQLNEGKPIMLATFGTFGNYSIDELNDVANSSIPDEYNVIVLCVGDMAAMTGTKITKEGYERNWSKFMVAKMLWDDLGLFYKNTWPFSVFADKDRNILYYSDGWIKPVKEVKLLLDQIQAKKMVYGKCWYTEKGEIAGKDDAGAYYYVEVKSEENKIIEKQGTKTKSLSETNYIYKDNVYYYDGIVKSSTEEGQETFIGQFKEGVPVTALKGWHSDGKIRIDMPLNGTAKAFDTEGQLTMEGPMQNGLGNGSFSYYAKGVKTAEYSYKEGKLEGLFKEFKDGELVKEYLIMPQYEDYREIKSGLQAVKIREVQSKKPADAKGFLAFIPWTFQDVDTLLAKIRGVHNLTTPEEYIRMIALSRIMLPNVKNIQASWLTVGKQTAEICLHAGANDFGSIMLEENVVSAAGAPHRFTYKSIQEAIREAGFEPQLRNQQYEWREIPETIEEQVIDY